MQPDQAEPLVLDLLDDKGCHISDTVTHVARGDAHGAFLLAAATHSAIVVFSLQRYAHRPSYSAEPFSSPTCLQWPLMQQVNKAASLGTGITGPVR